MGEFHSAPSCTGNRTSFYCIVNGGYSHSSHVLDFILSGEKKLNKVYDLCTVIHEVEFIAALPDMSHMSYHEIIYSTVFN